MRNLQSDSGMTPTHDTASEGRPERRLPCETCQSDVAGAAGQACPNCGTALRGVRRWRRTLLGVVIGLALMIVGGAGLVLYASSNGIPWYGYYSSNELLSIMKDKHKGSPQVRAAWEELRRRDKEYQLNPAVRSRLIDACLQAQAAGPKRQIGGETEFLGESYLKERMTAAQKDAFLRHLVQLMFLVRSRVPAGYEVPFELVYKGNLPNKLQFRLADVKILEQDRTLAEWPEMVCTTDGNQTLLRRLPALAEGAHKVTLQGTVQVRMWGLGGDGLFGYQVRHAWPVSLPADLQVTPPGVMGVRVIGDATLKSQFTRGIRPAHLEFSNYRVDYKPGYIDGDLTAHIDLGILPVGVAFEVFARVGGKEHPLGLLWRQRHQDRTAREVTGRYSGPLVQTVQLVLRGGPEAACGTVEMTEAWQGEIVYEDVPVRMLPTRMPD